MSFNYLNYPLIGTNAPIKLTHCPRAFQKGIIHSVIRSDKAFITLNYPLISPNYPQLPTDWHQLLRQINPLAQIFPEMYQTWEFIMFLVQKKPPLPLIAL